MVLTALCKALLAGMKMEKRVNDPVTVANQVDLERFNDEIYKAMKTRMVSKQS